MLDGEQVPIMVERLLWRQGSAAGCNGQKPVESFALFDLVLVQRPEGFAIFVQKILAGFTFDVVRLLEQFLGLEQFFFSFVPVLVCRSAPSVSTSLSK